MKRREILTGAAVMLFPTISGCSLDETQGDVTDIRIRNKTESEISGMLTIEREGWKGFEQEYTIPGQSKLDFEEVVSAGGNYTVEVTTDSGLSGSFTWSVPSSEANDDAHGLVISVTSEEIEFTSVVA